MKISAKTDVGKVRSNNQDSYAAGDLTSEVSRADRRVMKTGNIIFTPRARATLTPSTDGR